MTSNDVAIICEINPFHNGHKAIFDKAKELCGAGSPGGKVFALMGGNFTQRGEPAALSKWARAEIAILMGADIVIELPTAFATQSAEFFAKAAISTLKNAGFCGKLLFGSECGDCGLLKKAAGWDSPEFRDKLKELIKSGIAYPVAAEKLTGVKLGANDILGTEYIRAIREYGAGIEPMAFKRIGGLAHGDLNLPEIGKVAGASGIRKILKENNFSQSNLYYLLSKFMPELAAQKTIEEIAKNGNVPDFCDFGDIILAKIRLEGVKTIEERPFSSGGIANKIYDEACSGKTVSAVVSSCTSKIFTASRIKRILLGTIIDSKAGLFETSHLELPYVRVLAVRDSSVELLSEAGRSCENAHIDFIPGNIPPKVQWEAFSDATKTLLDIECKATDIYSLCLKNNDARRAFREMTTPLMKISN